MAIRNTCYGGACNFTSEYVASADLNDTFTATYTCNKGKADSVITYSVENAINIAKLQYCNSVADIDHDYMVVDVFTDSNGYNNTICIECTISTYCSSGLNGYYLNYSDNIECVISSTCLCSSGTTSYCNTCSWACRCTAGTAWICMRLNNAISCFDKIEKIFICMRLYSFGNGCGLFCISNLPVPFSLALALTSTCCYSFVWHKKSECCFDFYINGSCNGNVCYSSFPNICICNCICTIGSGSPTACSAVCIFNYYINCYDNKNISTKPILYNSPVKTSYLSLEKFGAGSVVYDVYNANNTSTAVSTSLALNQVHTLPCAFQCHVYSIKQCNDDVSCIKSYAVAVGIV